jgi:hypothetical protein
VPRGLVGAGMTEAIGDLVIVGTASSLAYVGALALLRSPDLAWVVGRLRRRGTGATGGVGR